jgi:hypothetical protein
MSNSDIITNITTRPVGLAAILVRMSVSTFKTAVILYVVCTFPNIFVVQDQFSDPVFISSNHKRENVQFVHKAIKGFYFTKINTLPK